MHRGLSIQIQQCRPTEIKKQLYSLQIARRRRNPLLTKQKLKNLNKIGYNFCDRTKTIATENLTPMNESTALHCSWLKCYRFNIFAVNGTIEYFY